ncbi:hypothetical protein GLYMA_04G115650v4 [Glycine max]|nr:hypothetical protein GLYMA_04G115650v4 [Glycine max]KAH1110923.1 hypothetical protein GYH30_009640 [Glycine max]
MCLLLTGVHFLLHFLTPWTNFIPFADPRFATLLIEHLNLYFCQFHSVNPLLLGKARVI